MLSGLSRSSLHPNALSCDGSGTILLLFHLDPAQACVGCTQGPKATALLICAVPQPGLNDARTSLLVSPALLRRPLKRLVCLCHCLPFKRIWVFQARGETFATTDNQLRLSGQSNGTVKPVGFGSSSRQPKNAEKHGLHAQSMSQLRVSCQFFLTAMPDQR